MQKQGVTEGVLVKVQRFSTHDGPGIRTTVFMKGCPLRCLWCSNPETQESAVEIAYDKTRCIPQCYECVGSCPNGNITAQGDYIAINRKKCNGGGGCTKACYRKAITRIGEVMSVTQVADVVERDKPFYEQSGGGVTISGGEPLLQPEFTRELASECKRRGISTALDTTGYADWDIFHDALKYIDLVLYDIKHLDSTQHQKYTGVNNELILENVLKVSQEGIPVMLRVPLIPGINDSTAHLLQLTEFAKSMPHLPEVHLLPYHKLGKIKYAQLDREYRMGELQQSTKEDMSAIRKIMEAKGLSPTIIS